MSHDTRRTQRHLASLAILALLACAAAPIGEAQTPDARSADAPNERRSDATDATLASETAAAFVGVEGDRFVLAGAPFRFVGANVAIMHGPRHRAAVDATLDAARADGLTVVRVWALGEQPVDAAPWSRDYAFRIGPEGWVEESFVHLDRVLAAARARGLRVIVVLGNRWADYGGAPQYLAWAGQGTPLDPAGAPSLLAMPTFVTDPTIRVQYLAHVRRVVGRTNTVSGLPYRDDPTILAWELVNENDAPPRVREALVDWTRALAREVHAIDPRHLVGAGHIGYVTRAQRDTWLAVHRLPEIDYADAHAYPTSYERVRSLRELDDFVDDPVQLAHHVLHKPFVWGEVGFSTRRRVHAGLRRTRWWERFFERSSLDRVDGALAWIYATSADRPRDHGLDVDGPGEARTRDVRVVLARYARRWRSPSADAVNPRLDDAQGEAPLWDTVRTLRGRSTPLRPRADPSETEALVWRFDPRDFALARAEAGGRWDGEPVAHIWASGEVEVVYRLVTPRRRDAGVRRVVLRARASSELPGRGEGRTDDDASEIAVTIDGLDVGHTAVIPDDGVGAWIEIASEDPVLLHALSRRGVHELALRVPPGPRANGLCLYADRSDAPTETGYLELRVER
jgi:mannan endo-1,4-beta-mannosidase